MRYGDIVRVPNMAKKNIGIIAAEYESTPWSNSSPNGLLVLVRRACFPSIPSRNSSEQN